MSSRGVTVAVTGVAAALVTGGLYLTVGNNDAGTVADGSIPAATRPIPTAAPPATAVFEAMPDNLTTTTTGTGSDGTTATDDGLLPVPNVIGTSRSVAESRLGSFSVEVEVVSATSGDDFDEITAQTPAAGDRLPEGGTVELVYSERPIPDTVPADPLPLGQADSVELGEFEVGECGLFRVEDRVQYVDPVDCDEAHDTQFVARVVLEGAPDEYDESAIDRLLRAQCAAPWEEFIGVSVSDSQLRLFTIRPSPTRYVDEANRDSICLLIPADGIRVIGSAEGTLW